MNSVRVRPAVIEDIPMLPAIEMDAASRFPPSDLPPDLAQPASIQELRQGVTDGTLWVALDEGEELVGFLLGRAQGDSLHIVEMDVRTNRSGRGIGSALLQEACTVAMTAGFRTVTLTTFEHLAWNAPFYAKRGFQPVSDPSPYPHLRLALHAEAARGLKGRLAMVKHAV
jgi:GNAT superfamily N-acetyltransferase